ncbi:MAG: hypothetical protein ACYCSF_00065 [Acidimicrobiales bacterium]
MAFGQQSGPPASPRQVHELLALLKQAGHSDFRDARGPMGFTQRQAGGKFTRQEAADLTDRLRGELESTGAAVEETEQSLLERAILSIPAEQLASELRRRGWTVTDKETRER